MTGVTVKTTTQSGAVASLTAPSGTYFVLGQSGRGRVDAPTALRSTADFTRLFGPRVSYGSLADDVQAYFDQGGTRAYALRVVGASATTGGLTLADTAAQPTVRLAASSPGAWSADIKVEVAAGTSPGSYRVNVYDTDDSDTTPAEVYNNLATPADLVARVTALSVLLTATDLNSATSPPGNQPAHLGQTALSAGDDDRTHLDETTYASYSHGLALLDPALGDGAVAIPGVGPTVHDAIDAHCRANNRIGLLSEVRGASIATLKATAVSLDSEYVGLFAPWIGVSDGSGGTRIISPEGAVAGRRAAAHESQGPEKAPAGGAGIMPFVTSLDISYDAATGDDLDVHRVSVVRLVQGQIRLYGWRSLSSDETNYFLLTGRDLLNRLVVEAQARLEPYVFATVDGRGIVLARVQSTLEAICEPIRQRGGLFERLDPVTQQTLDPGYRVVCDSSINPTTSLQTNTINARMSVRISPSAQFIVLTITKVALTAAV